MEKPRRKGCFVISLDFELFWGMFDKVTLEAYGDRILGERTAVPRMLEYFERFGIHATWATVGMLMARSKDELLSFLPPPHLRPHYDDERVSSYYYIETGALGNDESDDRYHFGPSLLKHILKTPHQECGNHTFSHYYAIDGEGNDTDIFHRDLEAFNAIARTHGVDATSIVFPRNQASAEALRTVHESGITAYRGNEDHILYRPRKDAEQSKLIRAFRLLDHYINISGYHTYPLPTASSDAPLNIKASRFLRPWSKTLRFLEPLRMRRIKNAMTHAAKRGEVFHLWWHPHNFGIHQEENFRNLENILCHYRKLREKYGMESASMREITARAHEKHL